MMEEKRPGQRPEAEIARSDKHDAQRTTAPGDGTSGEFEEDRQLLKDAKTKVEEDRHLLRAKGFGDHKGGDIS